MSTATMWLLLFVVAALALLIAALTKTKFTVQKISIIGIMAALSFVAYEFFRIPNVLGTGSSFHLGNTFTALTAMLLDGVSGGLAGADLIRQGGVQLLIQRRFLVGIQLYHDSPPHWPHKKFKN